MLIQIQTLVLVDTAFAVDTVSSVAAVGSTAAEESSWYHSPNHPNTDSAVTAVSVSSSLHCSNYYYAMLHHYHSHKTMRQEYYLHLVPLHAFPYHHCYYHY